MNRNHHRFLHGCWIWTEQCRSTRHNNSFSSPFPAPAVVSINVEGFIISELVILKRIRVVGSVEHCVFSSSSSSGLTPLSAALLFLKPLRFNAAIQTKSGALVRYRLGRDRPHCSLSNGAPCLQPEISNTWGTR